MPSRLVAMIETNLLACNEKQVYCSKMQFKLAVLDMAGIEQEDLRR